MKPTPARLARFAIQFLLVFAVLLAASPWLGPLYRGSVAAMAGTITETLRPPVRIDTTEDGGWSYVARRRDGRFVELMRFDSTGVRMATLNLLLLPSLLLATPVGWKRRLKLCGIGMLLLLALQTLTAIGWAKTAICLNRSPDHLVCNWVFFVFVTSGQFYAVAIWGLLSWPVWLAPADRGRGRAPRP